MSKRQIILVDDNPANLTACKKAMKDLYDVFPAPSAEKMFEILTHVTPDLILLDVEMPVMNGYEAMKLLKANEKYKEIPVIFLSAMDDAESEMEGLDLGAVDYIHKPFVSALLLKRVETHIEVIEGKREMQSLNKSIAELLKQARDENTPHTEADEKTIKALLTQSDLLKRMGHELREPLNTIIEVIEIAIKSDIMTEIKHCLARADVETRLILEIVNDAIDIE